jgi:hypothetical protein
LANYVEERSPLWNWAAAASIGVGAATTMLLSGGKIRDAYNVNAGRTMRDVASRAARATRFAEQTTVNTVSPNISDLTESILSKRFKAGTASAEGLRQDLFHAGYRAAMSTRRVSHDQAIAALSGIFNVPAGSSGSDMFKHTIGALSGLGADVDVFGREIGPVLYQRGVRNLGSRIDAPLSNVGLTGFSKVDNPYAQEIIDIFHKSRRGNFEFNWKFRYASDVIGGKEVKIPMMIGEIEGHSSKLYIPLENKGFTYSGENLQSRYAMREFYTEAGKTVPYSKVYVNRMAETVAGATPADIDEVLSREAAVLHASNIEDEYVAKGAVWQRSESVMTSGALAKARLIRREVAPMEKYGEEVAEGFLGSKFHPYVSPGAAGAGVLTKVNLPEEIYGPIGKFMTAEQRPGQFIRGEWGATIESKLIAQDRGFNGLFGQHYSRLDPKFKGSGFKELLLGNADIVSSEAYTAPQLWAAYAKSSGGQYKAAELNALLAAEEGYIHPSAAPLLEGERVSSKLIALDEGFAPHPEFIENVRGTTFGAPTKAFTIKGASVEVGRERGTGKAITTEVAGNRRTEVWGGRLINATTGEVSIRERIRVAEDEAVKVFGPGEKHMMSVSSSESQFRKVLTAAGISENTLGQPIEAILGGEILERNKTAVIMQQTEALSAALSQRAGSGKIGFRRTTQIKSFLENPSQVLYGNDPYEIQKRLIQVAKAHKIPSSSMGSIFGMASSDDLAQLVKEGVLSKDEALSIAESKSVLGLFKGRFGDLAKEGGVLKRGSLEQSAFRLLAGQGEVGQSLVAELAGRFDKPGSLDELNKMAQSVLGSPLTKPTATDLAELSIDSILSEESKYINLGRTFKSFGGSQYLYMPSAVAAPGLASTISESGDSITHPIVKQLITLKRLMAQKVPEEQLEKAAEGIRTAIGRHVEAAAAARGDIIGSVALTARKGFQSKDLVNRIHPKRATQMYDDLIASTTDEKMKEFLRLEQAKALGGEEMPGVFVRHPTTGPYSAAPIRWKVDSSLSEETFALANQRGAAIFKNQKEEVARIIDISLQTGTNIDTDGDKGILMAVSDRDTASRILKSTASGVNEDYAKYLLVHGEIKDYVKSIRTKDVIDYSNVRRTQISGIKKLRTAKTATGVVNMAMQKAKLGLLANAPDKYAQVAPFLEELEQIPISSKHGLLGESIWKEFPKAMEEKDTLKISKILESTFGPARELGGTLTVNDLTVKHTYKYDPVELAKDIVEPYHASKQDIDTTIKAASLGKGKSYAEPSLDELARIVNLRARGTVDVGTAAVEEAASGGGLYKTTASEATRLTTKVKNAGKAFWNNKWPLTAGVAAAAGLMLMAPDSAGRVPAIRPPSRSGRGEQDAYMPEGPGIRPPDPRMPMSPSVYDMGSQPYSTNANLYMGSEDLSQNHRSFLARAQSLGGSGRGRITIRDDRNSLDANQLANQISERL